MARWLSAPLCLFAASTLLGPLRAAPAPLSPLADGGQKLAQDDLAGAIPRLQQAARADPADAEARRLLAIAYLHSGQHTLAANAAQEALQQAGRDPEHSAVAALLLGKARYSLFVADFKACSSGVSSLPDMQQLLGQMATHKFETSDGGLVIEVGDITAQEDYTSLRSSMKEKYDGLLKQLKGVDEAYALAAAADPQLSGVHDGLGMLRMAQAFPGEARREFLAEMAQHGPSADVLMHLGELDAAEGHTDAAIESLRRAVALSPQSKGLYEDLARLYDRKHDGERRQWAQGMAALLRGDRRAAAAALAKSAPSTADLLCGQAQLALTEKRDDDARRLFTLAHDREPQNAEIVAALGDLEETASHHAPALGLYKQALALDPACDAAWYGAGLAYDGQGDRSSAVADYRQALATNPNDPLARLNLAADEADMGQKEQAASGLRDYLRRFPAACNTYSVTTMLAQLEAK